MNGRLLLLDTNVLSQVLQTNGDPAVRAFLDGFEAETLRVSVVSLGEIQKGVSLRAAGRRRQELEEWFATIRSEFEDQTVAVNVQTALIWGELTARMRKVGQNIDAADLLIAATALEHDMTVVTRNVSDFAPTGVPVLDPWNPPADPAPATAPLAGF
ncbi:MAG: type II toxin-antitoxin system VapC family toxin [Thermomicrobiales bacterium]